MAPLSKHAIGKQSKIPATSDKSVKFSLTNTPTEHIFYSFSHLFPVFINGFRKRLLNKKPLLPIRNPSSSTRLWPVCENTKIYGNFVRGARMSQNSSRSYGGDEGGDVSHGHKAILSISICAHTDTNSTTNWIKLKQCLNLRIQKFTDEMSLAISTLTRNETLRCPCKNTETFSQSTRVPMKVINTAL